MNTKLGLVLALMAGSIAGSLRSLDLDEPAPTRTNNAPPVLTKEEAELLAAAREARRERSLAREREYLLRQEHQQQMWLRRQARKNGTSLLDKARRAKGRP